MIIRDDDRDELQVVPKTLVARIARYGRARNLSPVEAATTLVRDRLDDLELRAANAQKLNDLTPAARSARGKKAIKARWDRHRKEAKRATQTR